MSYCGNKPGMCAGKASCNDHLCPGHPFMSGMPPESDDPPLWSPEEVEESMAFHGMLAAFALLVIVCVVLADYFSH